MPVLSFKHIARLLTIALTMIMAIPQYAYALDVTDIRFGQHPEKTRLVMELSEQRDFRTFVLSDPYRMVIDLPAFNWKAGSINNLERAGISAIRHGNLKPGISRIVFDLNRPVSIHNAFILPGNAGNPNRLVIDFANTNANGFAYAKTQIHGNLDVDHIQQVSAAPTPKLHTPQTNTQTPKPLIVIDPGHGGVDPGAVGHSNIKEKNVVLALAKELRQQLLNSGQYRVIMTRETDRFIKLYDRVKFAQKHGGDLFISIHADSIGDPNVHGASLYTLSEKASDAQTAKLAARENKADLIAGVQIEVEDEAVMDILIDLARRNTQNQSKFFANTLVSDFESDQIGLLRRPHRYANFAVLKAPEIPSVLVEAGFMSNRNEANKLNTAAHRAKLAKALKKGIDAYFKTVKENERT